VTAEPPAGEPDDRVAADRPADSDGVNVNGSVGEALDPHALTGDVPQQHGAVGDGSHPHALDSDDVDRSAGEAPPSPAVAVAVFGSRVALAERFAAILADSGVSHGLVGPREVPRLWERHVLNCAVVHPGIPAGVEVIDVGSGAGLPGLALAIARPDVRMHLVEPMLRRTTWLQGAVEELGLDNVEVHRGRAEQFWDQLSAPVVTARAVARLGELARWSLPLLQPGGSMLALKGTSAQEELDADRAALRRLGAVSDAVETYGADVVSPATIVVRVTLGAKLARRERPAKGSAKRSGRRRPR
jgi:16S rRNA (guanine527-N7)-methyltransferase